MERMRDRQTDLYISTETYFLDNGFSTEFETFELPEFYRQLVF